MTYRAVFFDLDGTLLDTLEDISSSANSALRRLGFPVHERQAYRRFIGDGVEALAARILPDGHRDAATVARVVAAIDTEYGRHWADNTRPYDGIPELLQELTARGMKMAILSNKPDDSAKLTVSRLLPHWRFELVMGARPGVLLKPDPAGALEIAERLGLPAGEFLYVGDTGTDMKTAAGAGMFPAGALWGFRTADELLAGGAKALLSHPSDLLF